MSAPNNYNLIDKNEAIRASFFIIYGFLALIVNKNGPKNSV
jgi:hypothetical protein